jgi:hypothetical protein
LETNSVKHSVEAGCTVSLRPLLPVAAAVNRTSTSSMSLCCADIGLAGPAARAVQLLAPMLIKKIGP